MGPTRALIAAVAVSACAAPAAVASLPEVRSGARPGPDILYAPPAKAPQLENAEPWRADPILVSGAVAYRDGEFLYQDFLYDDHGATGTPDPTNPVGPEANLYSPPAGTFTYPTDPIYGRNAADLVELRVKPLAGATALRVTLNTLKDATRTAFTVAFGSSDAAIDWPHGAGVSSRAQLFLTVAEGRAELVEAASGRVLGAATVDVDMERRQVDVRIPHSLWNPGRAKVALVAGVGLWDADADKYLAPEPGEAGEENPGGGVPGGARLFNVGPRLNEPQPDVDQLPTYSVGDAAVGAMVQAAWWREKAQATALTLGEVSEFALEVDFAKLADRADDESAVPKTGSLNRILASHYEFGQGYDPEKVCFDIGANFSAGAKCVGRMVGRLQPYTIYVPHKPQPSRGWGMTLLLHSLSGNYNQYANSKNQSQLGERGRGSIVITPAGRGPDGFYAGIAEADTFEVWADVARRYKLDPDWTVVSGYSMGAFGTYRLLARYPDLFARGFSVVGAPGTVRDQLAALRNTPLLTWNAAADELVNVAEAEKTAAALEAAGLRFVYDLFVTADHLTLATNDEYGQAADWLGEHEVDRNPPHVTYVVDPAEDSAEARAVADHAYWLSGVTVRDVKASQQGTIDARSLAFGIGPTEPTGVEAGAGTLNGGSHGPKPYIERKQDWKGGGESPVSDRLDVAATNVAGATVDAARARLSCAPVLDVKSDGPLDLRIDCAEQAVRAKRCSNRVSLRLPRVRGARVVRAVVSRRGRRVRAVRGRNVKHVAFRRVSRRAFTVRVTIRTTSKKTPRVTVLRRVGRC